jgi:hypothetical protein
MNKLKEYLKRIIEYPKLEAKLKLAEGKLKILAGKGRIIEVSPVIKIKEFLDLKGKNYIIASKVHFNKLRLMENSTLYIGNSIDLNTLSIEKKSKIKSIQDKG